jgi:hypothetical protein
MTKQQTIETLQKQLPSFYSLEQVISIINGVEDNNNTLNEDLIQTILQNVRHSLKNSDNLIDYDSVVFDLDYNNRISLSVVDVDIDQISDIIGGELFKFTF